MAGTVVADTLQAASTSTLVIKNGVANTPPTIQDSAGTQIGTFCRAWVNFNGTTVTNPASMTGVRGSFNVSSVLDNGTGDYTINFTTAMPDANYSSVMTGVQTTSTGTTAAQYILGVDSAATPSASSIKLYTKYIRPDTSGFIDLEYINVAIFR